MFHNENFLGEIGKQACLAVKKKFLLLCILCF